MVPSLVSFSGITYSFSPYHNAMGGFWQAKIYRNLRISAGCKELL
jgi:hypothetical protein